MIKENINLIWKKIWQANIILIGVFFLLLLPQKWHLKTLKSNGYISLAKAQISQAVLYQEKILSSGYIINSKNHQLLYKNLIPQQIAKILVKEKNIIQKGQVLLWLGSKEKIDKLLQKQTQLKQEAAKLEKVVSTYSHNVDINGNADHSSNLRNAKLYKTTQRQLVIINKKLQELEGCLNKLALHSNASGIITKILIKEGDFLSYNQAIIDINEYSIPKIIAEVSDYYWDKIELNSAVKINNEIPAYIAKLKLQTEQKKTVQLEINLHDSQQILMEEYLHLEINAKPILAHRINWSTIIWKDGIATVKSINHNKQITEHVVNVISYDEDGIWITGLPDKVNLIVLGKNMVSTGNLIYREFKQ